LTTRASGASATTEASVAGQLDEMRMHHLSTLTLCSLIPLGIALTRTAGWLGSPHPFHAWPTALILCLGLSATYWLQPRRANAAAWIFIVTLVAASSLEAIQFPGGPALYFFGIAGMVAALLRSKRSAGATLLLILAAMAITVMSIWSSTTLGSVFWPVVVSVATGFIAWLGTHRLGTILQWHQETTHQAIDAAHEAQTHRAELMRLNKELDGAYLRLERMNNMLVLARKEAEEAKMLKVQFANAVSHELRSPINLIIGFSDMMMNAPEVYAGQAWSPRLKNHVAQIYQSSQHLSQLIDDVLDMSRIDAYRLSLVKERTDITKVITEAYEIVHSLFEARKLYLRVDVEPNLPEVMLDHTRIRQVLLNLLTNAVRFTTEGGVTISARLAAADGSQNGHAQTHMVVAVSDTGIGIEKADLPKLFRVFCQLEGAYRWNRGSGLGLSISKQLVELHGGSIWADSEVGKGTTFSFSLPTDPEGARVSTAQLRPEAEQDRFWDYLERKAREHKSLIAISDEPNARRLITAQSDGFDITWLGTEADEAEIQRTINNVRPAALLQVSGAQPPPLPDSVLEELDGIPVISLNLPGLGRPQLPDALSDYLIKPVSRRKLADALARLERRGNGGADTSMTRIHRVLIVEDETAMREFLALALANILGSDSTIIDVESGQAALATVASTPLDLVLVDLNLPDADGLDLAVTIAERTHGNVPIIAVTARDLHLKDSEVAPDVITCTRGNHFSQHELERILSALISGFSPATALADIELTSATLRDSD
jgi:signal transduction histidine kinase/CheY-like chemotaxis protein